MPAVGVRFPTTKVLCSSKEECQRKGVIMKPGVVYEAVIKIDGQFDPNETMAKMYEALKAVRQKYPGVIINYVSIGNDGQTIIIQMFDTPGWQLIAVLLLILGILFVVYKITQLIVKWFEISFPTEEERKDFWNAAEALMWGVAISLPIGGVAYLIDKMKKKG
jgi:hypothetical protein